MFLGIVFFYLVAQCLGAVPQAPSASTVAQLTPQDPVVVVGCSPATFSSTIAFFTDEVEDGTELSHPPLGFRLHSIFPADDPDCAELTRGGCRLRLERTPDGSGSECQFRLPCLDNQSPCTAVEAPNGARVVFTPPNEFSDIPELVPQIVVCSDGGSGGGGGSGAWISGRAGMLYRDLLPTRLGGRFIASVIRIPAGGPVPDYSHYHIVRCQLIYCLKGWVKVVYEGQGAPFVLRPGDLVMQPPGIRHRVLEASDGLEVLEFGCPAKHPTFRDHETELPISAEAVDEDNRNNHQTGSRIFPPPASPYKTWGGQRFVHFVSSQSPENAMQRQGGEGEQQGGRWAEPSRPNKLSGQSCFAVGMGTSGATNGLVETRTVRFCGNFNEEGIPASNGTQSGAADPVADSDGGDGGGGGGDDDRVGGDDSAAPIVLTHTGEFSLVYVSKGACALHCENQDTRRLGRGLLFSSCRSASQRFQRRGRHRAL